MATPGNEVINSVLRQAAGRGGPRSVTDQADAGLDMAMEGIATLRAALGVLSPENGDDESVPVEIDVSFDAAVDALAELRDAVDELLVANGLEPTTADAVTEDNFEEEA